MIAYPVISVPSIPNSSSCCVFFLVACYSFRKKDKIYKNKERKEEKKGEGRERGREEEKNKGRKTETRKEMLKRKRKFFISPGEAPKGMQPP